MDFIDFVEIKWTWWIQIDAKYNLLSFKANSLMLLYHLKEKFRLLCNSNSAQTISLTNFYLASGQPG